MGNFFNVDNAFFSFMGKLWDMILLSFIWVICCIPIVTIGPATTALYYAIVKVIRRERGYATKEFFHSLKDNLKLGALSTLVFLVGAWILYVDFRYADMQRTSGGKYGDILMAVFVAVTTITLFVFLFIYPILSRFTLNFKGLFKTTFIIAMKHFPTSFMLAVILCVCAIGVYLFFPLIFLVPSIYCFISSFLIERIFKKYMPKPEGTPEETGRDLWYWE